MHKNKLKLTDRMQVIADLVNDGEIVADIGTDHAYLPIFLISENKCKKCIAADVATGPLSRAEEYIEKHLGKTDRIATVLSDGLKSINESCDIITIAGMGGETIAQILEAKPLPAGQTVILQPMSKAEELRKFLYNNNFFIEDEVAVSEDRRIYSVIRAVKSEQMQPTEAVEIYISAPLLAKKDSDAVKYKEKVLQAVKKRLNGLEKAENKDEESIAEQRKICERLEKEI